MVDLVDQADREFHEGTPDPIENIEDVDEIDDLLELMYNQDPEPAVVVPWGDMVEDETFQFPAYSKAIEDLDVTDWAIGIKTEADGAIGSDGKKITNYVEQNQKVDSRTLTDELDELEANEQAALDAQFKENMRKLTLPDAEDYEAARLRAQAQKDAAKIVVEQAKETDFTMIGEGEELSFADSDVEEDPDPDVVDPDVEVEPSRAEGVEPDLLHRKPDRPLD